MGSLPGVIATADPTLVLRRLSRADAPAYAALAGRNRAYLARHGFAANGLGDTDSAYGLWEGDQLVGRADLVPHKPGQVGVGYWLSEDCTGRGLMTTALRALLEQVSMSLSIACFHAGVNHGNLASAALLTRLGFSVRAVHDSYTSYHLPLPTP